MALSYRLARIPDALQGRVNSAVRLWTYGTIPAGTALAGILMETIGTVHAVLVFAAVYLALAGAATLNPQIRQSGMSPTSAP